MTATETIRDRVMVSKVTRTRKAGNYVTCYREEWAVRRLDDSGAATVGTFSAEAEAYGVAALIVEYVEDRGMSEQDACTAATLEWERLCRASEEGDPADVARQNALADELALWVA